MFKTAGDYEAKKLEIVYSEFTIPKKQWICLNVYRPPSYNNFIIFFQEFTKSACMVLNIFDNMRVMDDFNIASLFKYVCPFSGHQALKG